MAGNSKMIKDDSLTVKALDLAAYDRTTAENDDSAELPHSLFHSLCPAFFWRGPTASLDDFPTFTYKPLLDSQYRLIRFRPGLAYGSGRYGSWLMEHVHRVDFPIEC